MKGLQQFLSKNHFWLFVIAFISLLVSVENNNEKLWTNDFKVYYLATVDFFKGNDPYIHNYGLDTGYFKYPPTTLYLFKPFTFFNYKIAQLIHLALLTFSLIYSFIFTKKIIENHSKKSFKKGFLYIGFALIAIHLVREFHMGNINLLLLVLFLGGLYHHTEKNILLSAFLWSLMLILKPIMILSVLLLVFHKSWRTILYMSGIGVLFFFTPIFKEGISGNFQLWEGWLNSVASHGEYIISENSLTYLTNYYLGIQSQWGPSFIFLGLLLSLYLIDYFKLKRINFVEWSIILTAFSPSFFVTDTEHFLLCLPLILIYLAELKKAPSIVGVALFAIASLLFSFNSNDLWGDLSNVFDAGGILGIGNLIFIGGYLWIKLSKRIA